MTMVMSVNVDGGDDSDDDDQDDEDDDDYGDDNVEYNTDDHDVDVCQ